MISVGESDITLSRVKVGMYAHFDGISISA